MTCIVGIEYFGGVMLAGDSALTSGWSLEPASCEKVFKVGAFGIGLSGSPRMGQLLRYKLDPPEYPGTGTAEYMATDFVDAVRKTLQAGGHAEKENEKERHDSSFLVAIHGQLFTVFGDYQATRWAQGFAATGSGQLPALGALHATQDLPNPRQRVTLALEAASEFSGNVGPPFHYLEVPK